MAGRGGGAYINGRYVANAGAKGGAKGGGRGRDENGRTTGWGGDREKYERKPGDEDVNLERKFDIDVLQPGESRIGYLFNMKQTRHYDEGGRALTGMLLYFLQRDGRTFRCTFLYRPYCYIHVNSKANLESMRDILAQRFANEGVFAEILAKEDLNMEDHIVGRVRKLVKLSFTNVEGLQRAVRDLRNEIKRQNKGGDAFSFFDSPQKKDAGAASALDSIEDLYEHDVGYTNRVCIDNCINCGKWFHVQRKQIATSADDIWDTQTVITAKDDMLYKPGLRIFAWDIECTKEPLKFPDSAHDRITLISVMADGSGFLIVNRSEVSANIEPLEYTPKPEYEGVFATYNEPDEASLIRRFFTLIRDTSPHVLVTFNGDFFDFPFVQNRAKAYNIDWNEEMGVQKVQGEDYYAGQWLVHLDCFAWVQRDSYLPCGARGLKAVTRYKLKYDPVELDPEEMTPFAKERPQELAAYSVSDAVATYYLYQKYIHDFIFALCSIIPYNPDDVLRKGSGTLCESLLMNQAFHANVVFPNKHVDAQLEFHEGTNRLIEQSTYEGARVECMRVGVYRADIKETFQLEPAAFQTLLNDLKKTVDFYLTAEEKVQIENVENYEEVLAEIEQTLKKLCDPEKVATQVGRLTRDSPTKSPAKSAGGDPDAYTLKLVEYEVIEGKGGVKSGGKKVKKASYRIIKDDFPLIYHLDVGAMYPNIILSNRLQPAAIVSKEFCNACTYNDPVNKCKRHMDWKWHGELYMATRADVKSIMNEMENEKRRYNHKERDTGEVARVKWSELTEKEQTAEITKAVRQFSQKAYRRLKSSVYEDKTDTVCQRENPFYVDTVRNFRDRRYMFKRKTKEWNKNLEKAEESGDAAKKMEAKDMVLLYDSLQLAHKCILNSFYGYVMRKGARWHSMKMAGIVTYTGSNLIREAREFCEQVGLPLELDTDGIWCLLPKSFPDTFKFKLKGGKELKMPYPNCVLNYRVHQKYTNHQYQTRTETGEWKVSDENSIFFEIDGPYRAMILPASTEEDKMLKKRYAVFEFDGSIAELKGFEVKRRGELRLIQVFQTEVFPEFLKGSSKEEVYSIVGQMANRWLDVIESKGRTMTDDEVIYFFSESKSMSKSVEASGGHKSVQVTTAKRLADFLGVDSYLKDEGISCHMLIASKPHNASCTERAIPVKIFSADYEVKKTWLRQWLQDPSLTDFDMRSIIDWDYYKDRLCAVFQKLISIPAAYQKISNPCPRVKVPEWLRKRVAEQNDRFQQRSLGLWLRKADPAGAADALQELGKRKLIDMEDLGGAVGPGDGAGGAAGGQALRELELVDFGTAPRRWLETQRLRWAAGEQASMELGLGMGVRGGWRASLFDEVASWAPVSAEVLRATWHIVAVETFQDVRSAFGLRVGDSVLVDPTEDMEDEDEDFDRDAAELQEGIVSGFVGSFVRVSLDRGDECLARRNRVQLKKEEGLFVLWVATGQGLALHRCEVLTRRRVVLALESDFDPETARCDVRPGDLAKGLQVWPLEPSDARSGPGVVTSAAPEIGLCSVQWSNGVLEPMFSVDLQQQCGTAKRVLRDPPRNMRHPCLVELELQEGDFQRQRGEGALGDGDAAWPRVDAVYEVEQPLLFDMVCRLGTTVRLATPEKAQECIGKQNFRLAVEDMVQVPQKDYLLGLKASRNIYLHLCFDRTHPSRAFCGLFSPSLAEAWVCFGGLHPAEGEAMRAELEQALAEQLTQMGDAVSGEGSVVGPVVHVEVFFNAGKSLSSMVQWADQRLQDARRRDGGSVCVLCSQLPTSELRGVAPSFWVEQRQLRHLGALREMPICRAPFPESDGHFPALDWVRWACRRFASKLPQLFGWWRQRLALCRVASLPVCNAPEMPAAMVPAGLDALFSRQLRRDSQLPWASPTCRPDLGETTLALVDAQEDSIDTAAYVLGGKDVTEGRSGGQVNRPGTYRSICLEMNLRTKLCVCALQHARFLSDMEGGELSRKMIRKVAAGENQGRNLDHTSEVSVTSMESLITMVQDIAGQRDAKEAELLSVRQAWAAQSADAKAAAAEAGVRLDSAGLAEDDALFVEVMVKAGHPDSRLAAQLAELRAEHDAHGKLLDGLYGWLASPTSLMYDPALMRKVHQYMDKVLQLLISVLKKNGCAVVHASYTRLILATGKLRVLPDVQVFWQTLCENIQGVRPLEPLALSDAACLAELYYGVIWMDPSNWAGVPIDGSSGHVIWKAQSCWKIADFLPPAVRPSLILYAGELLLGPQRELGRRCDAALLAPTAEEMDEGVGAEARGMCVDAEGEGNGDGDHSENESEGGGCGEPAAANPAETLKDESAANDADVNGGGEAGAKTAEMLDDLKTWAKGAFFEDLRRRVLAYVTQIQDQQQREVPGGLRVGEAPRLSSVTAPGESSGDESEGETVEAEAKRAERLRRHLEQKWSFPDIPGRRAPPRSVEFEFMRSLVRIFQLEDWLADETLALRDRLCQKLRLSSFAMSLAIESPCFPLILRDLTCPWCCTASHVDVTSHPARGPGLWICSSCDRLFDKDAVQARLVGVVESAVQAWHSQEIVCQKCRRLKTSNLRTFCECFGLFQLRFASADFMLLLKVLRSLVGPHDLPWLGEVLDLYEPLFR